jgi:peptidoglycan L-alanyl-D-glutamate endopeptidase CwlK
MSKSHITQAQTALAAAGFYNDKLIDGDFGKDSLAAVLKSLDSIDNAVTALTDTKIPPLSDNGKYKLSATSLKRLAPIHADLQKVVNRAIQITTVDFTVGEGMRTLARQKELVAKGASKTMNSRHLTGHAVDLIALDEDGQVTWDWDYYHPLADAIKQAAKEVGVSIEWGGDWKTFKDGPHYQLPWSSYPK